MSHTDWFKTFLPLIAAATTLLLGWLVSSNVTDCWDRKKALRERALAAMQELAELYGEFLSTRKNWDTLRRFPVLEERARAIWQLVDRATSAEGRFEALLVRLSSERRFTADELDSIAATPGVQGATEGAATERADSVGVRRRAGLSGLQGLGRALRCGSGPTHHG